MNFDGKVVFITGGTSGIGLAIAKEFAFKNASVCIAGRRTNMLSQALDQMPANDYGQCAGFRCDVTDPEQVKQVITQISQEVGPIDILVNSAGVAHPGYLQDLELETFRHMMEINYFGIVHTVKETLPEMMKRRSGSIINIGSIASYIGMFGYSAYGASKFAMRGFTESLRMEAKPYHIHVGIVLPPDTNTPQLTYENKFKPLELKYLYPPLGVISPEKVARAVIKGVIRRQYEIIPDLGFKFIIQLHRLVGPFSYQVLDWLLKAAIRRKEREQVD